MGAPVAVGPELLAEKKISLHTSCLHLYERCNSSSPSCKSPGLKLFCAKVSALSGEARR